MVCHGALWTVARAGTAGCSVLRNAWPQEYHYLHHWCWKGSSCYGFFTGGWTAWEFSGWTRVGTRCYNCGWCRSCHWRQRHTRGSDRCETYPWGWGKCEWSAAQGIQYASNATCRMLFLRSFNLRFKAEMFQAFDWTFEETGTWSSDGSCKRSSEPARETPTCTGLSWDSIWVRAIAAQVNSCSLQSLVSIIHCTPRSSRQTRANWRSACRRGSNGQLWLFLYKIWWSCWWTWWSRKDYFTSGSGQSDGLCFMHTPGRKVTARPCKQRDCQVHSDVGPFRGDPALRQWAIDSSVEKVGFEDTSKHGP